MGDVFVGVCMLVRCVLSDLVLSWKEAGSQYGRLHSSYGKLEVEMLLYIPDQ